MTEREKILDTILKSIGVIFDDNDVECTGKVANLILGERAKVLAEVRGWLDEMPIYMETDDHSGGKPSMASFRAELRAKLDEMGGEK